MTKVVDCPFCENGMDIQRHCCGNPVVWYHGMDCCGQPVEEAKPCEYCKGTSVITEEYYMLLKLQDKLPVTIDFASNENYALKA